MQEKAARRGRARISRTVRTRFGRVFDLVRRAVGFPGPDRDAILLILKSVVAATLAWVLANNVLKSPSATFASFTALLMVQATVSQSLERSARYAAAMVFGVILAGVVTPVLGVAVLTFGIMLLIAIVLGRWHKLGYEGPQVGVAALFAYSSFTQAGAAPANFLQLASIAGLVLLGCALGITTNLVLVPPLRYRSAEYGIRGLARSLCELLTDLSDGLRRRGVPDTDQADAWLHRSEQFPQTVAQARSSVEHAAETMRFNPRRLLLRHSHSFQGHRAVLNALERATEQTRSAVRVLAYAANTNHPTHSEHEDFLSAHAEVLASAAETAHVLGELHSADSSQHVDDLAHAVERARRAYTALAEQTAGRELDNPGEWPLYGALQTDAHRIVEDLVQGQQNLSLVLPGSAQDPEYTRETGSTQDTADQVSRP